MSSQAALKLSSNAASAFAEADRKAFLQESIDLFTHKRRGHFIHRMYMNADALHYWSRFMEHPGYYVTRSELQLIFQKAAHIGQSAGHIKGITGIENGPGTPSAIKGKTIPFFSAMPDLHTYIGRDWSPAIINSLAENLGNELGNVRIIPDLADFTKEALPSHLREGRKVMAEFGVTKANMEGFPDHPFPSDIIKADLRFYRSLLDTGDIYVMTFDANQDGHSIEYAYTSEWLTQWGRELFRTMKAKLPFEGDFDPESFTFRPQWHSENFISTNNMVADRKMEFALAGIPIVTEKEEMYGITNSYKFPLPYFIDELVPDTGFDLNTSDIYQDDKRRMTMPMLSAA